MAPRRRSKRVSQDRLSLHTSSDLNSVDTRMVATQTFYGTNGEQALALIPVNAPSHTTTRTWKSPAVKEQEEYERLRQRARHFVPELFKFHTKHGHGRPNIFPQNVTEWMAHKMEMLAIAEAENQKNCTALKAQIEARQKVPMRQRKLKSAFGKEGKVFSDGLSPVLALPTIWSAEYRIETADWPSKEEQKWFADPSKTSGRFLPPPRIIINPAGHFLQQPLVSRAPLDETGPVFSAGPGAEEVYYSNLQMNNDASFEAKGSFYLGKVLMEEIGEGTPADTTESQENQMAHHTGVQVIYEEGDLSETPDVDNRM